MVECPNNYHYRVPDEEVLGGSVIRCEDFDLFYGLINEFKDDEAKALVVSVQPGPSNGYDKTSTETP